MARRVPSPQPRSAGTAEAVFQRLVAAVLAGQLPAGQPVREAQLARRWRVSRTPMREAVRRAAEAGFLILRPNQAPLVRALSDADIDALYDLRGLLELHAFELAWPRFTDAAIKELVAQAQTVAVGKPSWQQRCLELDRALHEFWLGRCGNPWLERDLRRHYQFLRIFQRWAGQDETGLRQAYREHLAVLDAIQHGDRGTATNLLREHIAASAAIVKAARARAEQKEAA